VVPESSKIKAEKKRVGVSDGDGERESRHIVRAHYSKRKVASPRSKPYKKKARG